MSKIIEIFKDIKDAEREISLSQAKMNAAKNQIEEWFKNYRFKDFVNQKIFEGLSEDKRLKLLEERAKREKKLIQYNSASLDANVSNIYSISSIFDPQIDAYSIYDIETKDDKIRLLIDPHKTREYLGCAGGWIIDTYKTSWFKIEELNKLIDNI